MVCGVPQDMKEKHEKETALKAERDVLAKDAVDKEAANLVTFLDAYDQKSIACSGVEPICHAIWDALSYFVGVYHWAVP